MEINATSNDHVWQNMKSGWQINTENFIIIHAENVTRFYHRNHGDFTIFHQKTLYSRDFFITSIKEGGINMKISSIFHCIYIKSLNVFRQHKYKNLHSTGQNDTTKLGVRLKGPPLGFFRHYATFFRNFLDFVKGYPLELFEVFGL